MLALDAPRAGACPGDHCRHASDCTGGAPAYCLADTPTSTTGPCVGILDGPAALARKREVEARLGAIRSEADASKQAEREARKLENAALDARLR